MSYLRQLFNFAVQSAKLSHTSIGPQRLMPAFHVPVRTFKDKDVLRLRCKDCYYKRIDERWFVFCETHPRHKQRELIKDERTKWIVTHVTRNGRPFQKKPETYILNLCPPGPFDYRPSIWNKRGDILPHKKRIVK
ncbi:unnamed protein product [Sphagnum jensenii]|uniref:Large ribosomal subunit protein bL36m n=1 Tax=Sphagnum jensenii TaxID=128206 RepID=A0ABP0VF02_9BRYO